MSGGSMTKQLVKRVRQVLEEGWPSRTPGSPLPSAEQIAVRLKSRFTDLSRGSEAKLVKQLKDTALPEIQRGERTNNNPGAGSGSGGGLDSKKRRREDDDDFDEEQASFVIDTVGDTRMTKGGQKLVNYPDANRANNRLRQQYSKATPAGTDDASLNLGSASGVHAAEAMGTPVTSKVRGSGARSSRKTGGKKGSSRAADVGTMKFRDLGGVEKLLQQVRELIEYPLAHPEIYAHLGVEPPRGVLLHGPPGSGKSMLAGAMAAELAELGVTYYRVSAPEIVSGMSGESEKEIREIFAEAKACAPSLIFIDEIDAITGKRENAQREMERRIVAQLLTCMDDLGSRPAPAKGSQRDLEMEAQADGEARRDDGADEDEKAALGDADDVAANIPNSAPIKPVMVIGATNRPDALDSALRRAGRFDREICMGVPDEAARLSILKVLTSRLRLSGDFDMPELARKTPGYVGADLTALTKEAAAIAVNRIFKAFLEPGGARAEQAMKANLADAQLSPKEADAEARMDDGSEGQRPSVEAGARSGQAGVEAGGGGARESETVVEDGSGIAAQDEERLEVGGAEAGPTPVTTADGGLRREALTREELAPLALTMADFEEAVHRVQPSAKREGFATVPDVNWEDVGSLGSIREELNLSICEPILHPAKFAALGLAAPTGVLLYGPPGCGKTLVAKAAARESGANFISVKGPELLNKFVGESERAVRTLFLRAAASAPCVIFFDELDALCPKRGGEGGVNSERVVNQLLTEMDGLNSRKGVFIIAATNRPDMIDAAMLRPGRLDKLLYVRLPKQQERLAILETIARKMPLAPGVNLTAAAADGRTEGFSGADLAALMREAAMCALKESLARDRLRTKRASGGAEVGHGRGQVPPEAAQLVVGQQHLEAALRVVLPSVSAKDEKRYEVMASRLRQSRAKVTEDGEVEAAAAGSST